MAASVTAHRRAAARRVGAAGVFVALLGLASVGRLDVVRADPPPDRTVSYEIRRNGDPIGTHRVTFARQPSAGHPERFTVHHEIQIRVTLLALEAYRYTMDSRETWEGDRLLGLFASTDKNGDALRVFARAGGGGVRVRAPRGEARAPADAVPSSPQHDVFDVPRTTMIDAEDGRLLDVQVSAPATETLELGGRRVRCRRYTVSGDLDATLWYAPSGILVRKRLTAPDGSTILTVLM